MRITVEETEYRLDAGDFAFLQPGDLHTIEGVTSTVSPYVHIDIFYHPERKMSFVTRPGQLDMEPYLHLMQPRLGDCADFNVPVQYRPADPDRCKSALLKLVDNWNRHTELSRAAAARCAYDLILPLLETAVQSDGGQAVRRDREAKLNWATAYMNAHLSEPIRIRDLAGGSGLSESRFSALFREQFGMAPYRFLTEMRLGYARELLTTTDLPIGRIAEYCGMPDIHHFTKLFKRETGMPPGQYRNRIGGE